MTKDKEIKVLVDRLHNALLDHETQRQLVEEYEYDRTIENNTKKSNAIARAEGKAEGVRETALNLKKIGLPLAQIAQATGLSESEIERLYS